jgi:hypothetical protein
MQGTETCIEIVFLGGVGLCVSVYVYARDDTCI